MATAIPFGWTVQNAAGTAVSGARIHFTVPNTATLRTPFSDTGLSVPTANPVVADAAGYFLVYLSSELGYDITVKSADDSITYQTRTVQAGISGAQPVDATLTALAALSVADGDLIRATGVDTFETLSTAELVPRQTLESFGAVGDGSTDDLAAINLAMASGYPLAGTPGKTYRYVGRLLAPSRFNFDGNGCTLRPVYAAATGDTAGQRYAIYSSLGTFGAINTVSVQTAGTRVVTLSTTPSGIAAGDMICFFGTSLSSRWPITYRNVTAISGNDVTLDELIPYAIGGTITCRKIVPNPEFVLKNCTIDCTDLTDGTAEVDGVVLTLSYRDRILDNVAVTNLNINPANTDYIFYADYCLDAVTTNCVAENAVRNGSFESIFRFRSYTATGNRYSGDGFGIAPVNGDSFWVQDNEISGQHTTSVGSLSVRGVRPIGCLEGSIIGNTITDIDSGIKLEDCANIIVRGNFVRYCDTGVNFSDQFPSSRSGGHIIMDNIIEEYTENGIALGTTGTGAGLWKPCIVQGNRVGTSNASASQPIIIRGGTFEASGNVITDWPSGVNAFITATADGQLCKGILGSLYAVAPTATGRLGVSIDATHTGVAIDYDRVICNAPAGKFAALPPRKYVSETLVYSVTVNLNTTADQTLTLNLPDGFQKAYFAFIYVRANAAATSAVGGIYTGAGKTGTQIVAAAQTYPNATGAGAKQNLTINSAALLTTTTLYFALSTAHGSAATGELRIHVYPEPT